MTRVVVVVFFFSSRRRHTRYIGDWSSDVCSSDLELVLLQPDEDVQVPGGSTAHARLALAGDAELLSIVDARRDGEADLTVRSEERRVGKECRSRWGTYQ